MPGPVLDDRPVAVLDDDIQFIRMVERMLRTQRIGMVPITTPDVEDAVSVVAASGCRAALVDVYIYGAARGFALVEALRCDPRTRALSLIVSSGAHRDLGRQIQFLQEHHCRVLPKPFTMDELFARLGDARDAGDAPAFCGAGYSGELLSPVREHRLGPRFRLIPSSWHETKPD